MYKPLAKAKNSLSLSLSLSLSRIFHPKIRNLKSKFSFSPAFTIVELLIVIVIIGTLATIVIVAYNGITRKAQDATLQSDLKNASTTLEIANATDGTYPSDASSLKHGSDTVFNYKYTASDNSYCLQASSTKTTNIYSVTNGNTMIDGTCPLVMQTVTTASCPITRTRAYDARDNHSYWVQKLADGKCWMLTNLAYGGGGNNTYSDIIVSLTKDTMGNSYSYNVPYYYEQDGLNFTVEPNDPSISTDGTGQYGYLYNWCAAMGAQVGTSACNNASTDNWAHDVSVCPKNWRLPTGMAGGEFTVLNNLVNSGRTSSDVGLISAPWFGQLGGDGYYGYYGSPYGYYWSSTQYTSDAAYNLYFSSTLAAPSNHDGKPYGYSVRCLAAV